MSFPSLRRATRLLTLGALLGLAHAQQATPDERLLAPLQLHLDAPADVVLSRDTGERVLEVVTTRATPLPNVARRYGLTPGAVELASTHGATQVVHGYRAFGQAWTTPRVVSTPGNPNSPASVLLVRVDGGKALQCLLRRADLYDGRINGIYNERTVAAVNAWQTQHGSTTSPNWRRTDWVQLLSDGRYRPLKFGMSGAVVRRLQRALVAANQQSIPHSGLFMSGTQEMVRAWQQRVGLQVTGVMNPRSWEVLRKGRWR